MQPEEKLLISIGEHHFYDEDALLDRLSAGVCDSQREVVFVVGAPLTAPSNAGDPGVADVSAVVELIRNRFLSDKAQLANLDAQLRDASNKYQAAFLFLQGRRAQSVTNSIIREAVWSAHKGGGQDGIANEALNKLTDDQLAEVEQATDEWVLSPGVEALGHLISSHPSVFGKAVVTSNFDPLIEIAIRNAGGKAWRTALHSDGSLDQSRAEGCQIIHIHGYWFGTDTLHTGSQLLQKRPFLKNSLLGLLAPRTVVVLAYGGWSDTFTAALESLTANSTSYPEIMWAFYDSAPKIEGTLLAVLQAGIDRGRVTFYAGVDCHTFIPNLAAKWDADFPSARSAERERLPGTGREGKPTWSRRKGQNECDRPPSIETWVGRDDEFLALETSSARVIALCGIAGQGKSSLAAKYLRSIDQGGRYSEWDWRDCKEEGDRIRTQLIAIIDRFGVFDSDDTFSSESDDDLIEVFIDVASKANTVFVLDNVDHYVDLEKGTYSGLLDKLVREFCRFDTNSRLLITCRPQISYDLPEIINLPLTGLTENEAVKLFELRGASQNADHDDIVAAHGLTKGHAFWLDLMAAQVAKAPGFTLRKILEDIRRGRSETPDVLSPIWATLGDREKVILRGMAEIVRPETEDLIARIVSSDLNYKNFKKGLKYLTTANLIVVKAERNSPDLLDLHPLVREFVRRNFGRPERIDYIKPILLQYAAIIKGISSLLGVNLPFSLMERWSQKAELEVEAALYKEAFRTISDSTGALLGSGHGEEFVRVARKLFEAIDWMTYCLDKNFDIVLASYISTLDDLEEFDTVDELMARYEQTVPNKTARYIKFCNVKCYSYWIRGRFNLAVEWGTIGDDLKSRTGVDTEFDCAHNLALAKRDGGDPESALQFFLNGIELSKILDPDVALDSDDGALSGNVGRCLQLMGRHRDALLCFRKSAAALENADHSSRVNNQAWARMWIGEALAALGSRASAYPFFYEAHRLLKNSAPARARKAEEAMKTIAFDDPSAAVSVGAGRRVLNWINNRIALVPL